MRGRDIARVVDNGADMREAQSEGFLLRKGNGREEVVEEGIERLTFILADVPNTEPSERRL